MLGHSIVFRDKRKSTGMLRDTAITISGLDRLAELNRESNGAKIRPELPSIENWAYSAKTEVIQRKSIFNNEVLRHIQKSNRTEVETFSKKKFLEKRCRLPMESIWFLSTLNV